ncbi:MAG: nitrite/sulfite reductase [Gemmatimonadales bacterium]
MATKTDTREASTLRTWRSELGGAIPEHLAREIQTFEEQIERKRRGEIDDAVFAEMRLRRGVYGQRYDNGKRYDGVGTRDLSYPSGDLMKGPNTVWDAPGMQRIKIPFGGLSTEQMDVLADVAEEYSDGILHVTTRQDFQLHFVHIDDTPDLMRRLAAVGITTREACGNVVRNVTACPLAGVCRTESFDVTPYAKATAAFLLGHPDAQEFGRKFKIAFSGCKDEACGLASMHDIGAIATVRFVDGKGQRGFAIYVGGGLGAVPHQAKLLDPFVPEDELLPTCQAVCRVFARLGEKKNRARARLKFLVAKLGIDAFRQLVVAERCTLPDDPRWSDFLGDLNVADDGPPDAGVLPTLGTGGDGFDAWRATNVIPQRQEGYVVAMVSLPLGDVTAVQLRGLATLARQFSTDPVRTTVEQNVAVRWLRETDLPAFYEGLRASGLASADAGTIVDVTACPGTDTCKLGIASSRGLAGELRTRLAARAAQFDEAVGNLRIKVSGCFNSCGQHHVADIGFWGVSRKVNGRVVPHFQVVLGGQWADNAGAYGLAVCAVPSKNVPAVVDRLTEAYLGDRRDGEPFASYTKRVGKANIRTMLDNLRGVPEYSTDASYYSDWGDPREFTIGDMGVGECAGHVVSPVDFGLQSSERELFEAQNRLDKADAEGAADIAFRAMTLAARALARTAVPEIGEGPDDVVASFKTHFHDTKIFHDPFAKGKFANYFFRIHSEVRNQMPVDGEIARQRIEEAQLFIEAAHACNLRMSAALPQ